MDMQNKVIEQQNTEINKSNQTLQKTFSIISHDLRNPFNALLGYSTLLINNFDRYSEEKKMYHLKIIRSAAEINYNLTQSLLCWSLKQHQGYKVSKSKQNLQSVIEQVVVSLSGFTELKNALIEINIPNKIVFVDNDIIAVILNNLLTNSIKFSKKDSIIKILSSVSQEQLCISICSVGIILSDEKLKAIVYYLNATTTEEDSHIGFGLKIAKEMALLHNGFIEFYSENGNTEVRLILNTV